MSPSWPIPIPSGRSLLLWSERVVAALPANHPLTGREVVHWGELRHESLLMCTLTSALPHEYPPGFPAVASGLD
ncbi:LysR substrate-binding domain-containing protein [Bradyrhizobium canariense]|uniref:LysR substrate-binding domain-containing protein n=1 Tax=Bradyrhizobium canariense TaxID=255045 RepID=UPI003908A8B7